MATKGKDVGSAGKEKRGICTSPSKPLQSGSSTPLSKRSPKPSNLDSTTDKDHSSSSQKQIPSYLKPTISSSNVKKDESTQLSPSVQRRRSFDKPPSPTQIRKSLLSPNRKRPARSSSLTPSKAGAAPKPTPRLVKSQTSVAKSVSTKKAAAGGNRSTKKEAGTGSPTATETKAVTVVAESGKKPNNEPQQEDQDCLVHDVVVQEEEVKGVVDNVVQMITPHSSLHVDVASSVEANSTTDEDEKLMPFETSIVLEETTEDKICDQESKDESNSSQPKVEEAQDDEKVEEDAAENPISEEGSGEDQNKGEEPSIEDSREDQMEEEKAEEREGDEGSQKHVDDDEVKQEEDVDVDEEIQKKNGVEDDEEPEAENAASKQQQQSAGGKKDSQAQNDVIEETASKLLEKRKNKVRALVGAFETVISLQEPEGSN